MIDAPLLVDCDGVLADFQGRCIEIANSRGQNVKRESILTDSRKYSWWKESGLDKDWTSPGFCTKLQAIPGAREFIDQVRADGIRVVFVTSPPKDATTWPYERRKWLEKHFDADRDDVIFASDKRFVHGFCFIDDHEKNILPWQEYWNSCGAILVEQPWNELFAQDQCIKMSKKNVYVHKETGQEIYRMNDWTQILARVRYLADI